MNENPLVSILMPTYNDAELISGSINSVLELASENWELIIIDGSSDNTKKIISPYLNDLRIKYFPQLSRAGQLNALEEGATHVNGKYVTILHSDDLFRKQFDFNLLVEQIISEKIDGVYSDLIRIDERNNECGKIITTDKVNLDTVGNLFIEYGLNCVSDFFFVSTEKFREFIIPQYIKWNMPYWFNIRDGSIHLLKINKTTPWYKYRVYSNNYLHSDIGKFEMINGCLRTLIELSDFFDGKFYLKKGIKNRIAKTLNNCIPPYKIRPYSGNYENMIVTLYELIYGTRIPKNDYFTSLFYFYKNYPSSKNISIPSDLIKTISKKYYGSDARLFYDDMIENKVEAIYSWMLNAAKGGFGKIFVRNNYELQISKDILKFLNLKASVIIYER